MDPLSWTILSATAIYVIFHYFLAAAVWEERLIKRGVAPTQAQAGGVLRRRFSGAVWLGISSFIVLAILGRNAVDYGLALYRPAWGILMVAVGAVVIVPLLVLSARNPAIQARYPEIRAAEQTPRLVALNVVGWSAYLLGYEFFFRGFLLFSLTDTIGIWPGLCVMTALYTLAHLGKPAAETLSCIPMGLVFGTMALETGIWAPWLLHVCIAVASETAAAHFNPQIRWWAADGAPETSLPENVQTKTSSPATDDTTTTQST